MAEWKNQELEKQGKKKAKIEILEDGSSSLPSIEGGGNMSDGGIDEDGGGGVEDPLALFGSGVMMIILSKMDARSVALSRLVSRGWLAVASTDRIWAPKCEELWLGKAHIPRMAKVPGLSKMAAYSLSVTDSKRVRITWNDLCDHVWEFHFTENGLISGINQTEFLLAAFTMWEAPDYWRNLDPYWNGSSSSPPMRRYFHPDGSITADPDDRVWGGHESCYTIVTGLLADGKIREHYVRINRWPQMAVKRKSDWGWELSNHLYCYTSLPDSDKEDGTGPYFPLF